MKRILFITPFTPSNRDAGTNYTKHLLEVLSKNNKIDILLFRYSNDSQFVIPNDNVRILKQIKNGSFYKILNICLFPFVFPLFSVRFNWAVFKYLSSEIRKKNYDIVYFDFSQTFVYAKLLKHPCKILMSHDVIYQRFARQKSVFLGWVNWSENWLLHNANAHIFTFSQKDCILIREKYHLSSEFTNFFLPKDIITANDNMLGDYFVLFAMWKRYDNYSGLLWLIDYVFPYIDSTVKIIGGGLSNEIKNKLKCYSNIEYYGFVENPYPIISAAKALLAPLFTGAGVKVKVIESLACGTPVIGTDVAFEGIDHGYQDFMYEVHTSQEWIRLIHNFRITYEAKLKFRKLFLYTYTKSKMIKYINTINCGRL